jgi:hypothetical protein
LTIGVFIALLGEKLTRIGPPQQEIRRHAPAVWQRVMELDQTIIIGECRRLLDEGIAAGLVRPKANAELPTALLTIWLQGVANVDLLTRFPLTAADIVSALLDVFLAGILTEAGRMRYVE